MVSSKAVSDDFNLKFTSKFNHGFTNQGCLHCAILKALCGKGKKEPTRQDMFKMRLFRFWKCLKTTWNSPEQPVEFTQK